MNEPSVFLWAIQESVVKKALKHPKADESLRIEFKAKMEKYKSEGNSMVYIDESEFSHESTPH